MPEISAEIGKHLQCFRLCGTQLRATSGGAYALDWSIIKDVAGSMEIPVTVRFYRLLAAYENVFMEELNKK
jgi:hypothetical protein